MVDPVLTTPLRIGLALLLGAAAIQKVQALEVFRETLRDYRLLPEPWVSTAAAATPAIEATIAVAIALGLFVPGIGAPAALAAATLLGVYSAAIGINLALGRRHIDCGCSGPAHRQTISGWLVARNGVLMTGAAIAAVPPLDRPLIWLDSFSIVVTVAGLSLLWLAANQLMSEWPGLARLRRPS